MEKLNGHFQIAEPCHEDWNKMTPETQGRFCASCQKCVIDFTQLSFPEMVEAYQKAEGNVCARVPVNQLGNVREDQSPLPSKSTLSKLQKFALAILIAFGFSGYVAKAQSAVPETSPPERIEVMMGDIAYIPSEGVVRGTVESHFEESKEITLSLSTEQGVVQVLQVEANSTFAFQGLEDGTYYLQARDEHGNSARRKVSISHGNVVEIDLRLMPVKMGKVAYVPDQPREKPQSGSGATTETQQALDALKNISSPAAQTSIEIQVFPNPSHEVLKVKLLSDPQGPLSVWIFDMEGRLVIKQRLQGEKGRVWDLDVANLGRGTYLLELRSGIARKREKILLL